MDPQKDFFVELFNYCFPSDYRSELREKLRKCFQNNKNVSEYAFELTELFNMIGVMDECEKTVKLWNGLRAPIQKQLGNSTGWGNPHGLQIRITYGTGTGQDSPTSELSNEPQHVIFGQKLREL